MNYAWWFPDERIPETGGQANNSNYGPNECCYWHCESRLCYRCVERLSEATRPERPQCAPVEERQPGCSVPYQAPAAAPAPTPAPRPALLAAAAALALLLAHSRTHWAAPVPIVNVCDTRL